MTIPWEEVCRRLDLGMSTAEVSSARPDLPTEIAAIFDAQVVQFAQASTGSDVGHLVSPQLYIRKLGINVSLEAAATDVFWGVIIVVGRALSLDASHVSTLPQLAGATLVAFGKNMRRLTSEQRLAVDALLSIKNRLGLRQYWPHTGEIAAELGWTEEVAERVLRGMTGVVNEDAEQRSWSLVW